MTCSARTVFSLGALLLLLGLNAADLVHHTDHGGWDDCAFCVCHQVTAPAPPGQPALDPGDGHALSDSDSHPTWTRLSLDVARGRAPPRLPA